MGGVEVVGFFEMERLEGFGREGEGGFEADEESVMFLSERFESGEGGFEVGEGGNYLVRGGRCGGIRIIRSGFEGGAVGAIEVVAERCSFESGEGFESVGVEAESGFAFELLVFFPGG